MRLAIDLDSVVYSFSPVMYVNLCEEGILDPKIHLPSTLWDPELAYGITQEEFREWVKIFVARGKLWNVGPTIPYARFIMRELIKDGHELIITTDRGWCPGGERATKFWLLNEYIPYHTLLCTGTKLDADADVILDDKEIHVQEYVDDGRYGFCYAQPWNIHTEFDRVASWPEFYKKVIQLAPHFDKP